MLVQQSAVRIAAATGVAPMLAGKVALSYGPAREVAARSALLRRESIDVRAASVRVELVWARQPLLQQHGLRLSAGLSLRVPLWRGSKDSGASNAWLTLRVRQPLLDERARARVPSAPSMRLALNARRRLSPITLGASAAFVSTTSDTHSVRGLSWRTSAIEARGKYAVTLVGSHGFGPRARPWALRARLTRVLWARRQLGASVALSSSLRLLQPRISLTARLRSDGGRVRVRAQLSSDSAAFVPHVACTAQWDARYALVSLSGAWDPSRSLYIGAGVRRALFGIVFGAYGAVGSEREQLRWYGRIELST